MSPVYQANAIARDRRGKEIASRYPLWSGEVDDLRVAASSAGLAAKDLAADERVDTVVITIAGPKGERLTATEYGDDLRAGGCATADQSTLIADSSADPDEKRAAIERIKDAAVAAMPQVAQRAAAEQARKEAVASGQDTATVPGTDPLQDFFGPGWKPKESKTPEQGPFETSESWHKRVAEAKTVKVQLNASDVIDRLKRLAEEVKSIHGHLDPQVVVGEQSWRILVEHLRVTGQLPSGAGIGYTGPVVLDGVSFNRHLQHRKTP